MAPPGRTSSRAVRWRSRVGAALVALVLAAGCAAGAASDDASDSGAATGAGGAGEDEGEREGAVWTAPPVVRVGSQTMGESAMLGTRPATVAVIGDSITVAATEDLDAALTRLGLDVVAIEAQVGRRTTAGADVAELLHHQVAPELWVIALGTNDVGQYSDPVELAEQVRLVLDRIPPGAPVVWVDTWIRGRPEESARVNAAIRTVLDGRPGSVVVAWSDHALGDGVLSADGVHLTTEVGTQRFASVVAGGVETLVGPPR